MTTVHIVSPRYFELWHAFSPDHPGIGGSETMHCEVAWRLAARGHRVISYAPIPAGKDGLHRGVEWRHLDALDYLQPGLWILVRGFGLLRMFAHVTAAQHIWCVFQDVDEPDLVWQAQAAHLAKLRRLVTLCETHYIYHTRKRPEVAAQVSLSRNGIRGELVDEVLAEGLPRHPYRLTYASSPDRGLYGLLQAFRLIRFLVPEAELHICYGLDNMSKLATQSAAVRWVIDRLRRAASQPGVEWRGRLGQPQLYREWAQTALMVSPTNFSETGYITLMEAQALGAIPIVHPRWAAAEYQHAGFAIEGDAEHDALTLRRYAMAAVHLLRHPDIQDEIRPAMMAEARKRYDWEGVVEQYEQWMQEDGVP